MQKKILEEIADQLRQSGEYRIINKYYKPEGYNTDSSTDKKLIGVFLDTETTGLNALDAELVGIAFSYEKGKGYYVTFPVDFEETKRILDTFKLWSEDIFGWYYFTERSVFIPGKNGNLGHYENRKIKISYNFGNELEHLFSSVYCKDL